MNSSSITIIVSLVVLFGFSLLISTGLRREKVKGEYIPNQSTYKTDEELETKHLDKVLTIGVLVSSLLTIMIPLYYLGEEARQESFVEEFHEVSIERGEHLYEEFGCGNCHGPDGGGGAASYVEKRSGVTVTWAAPAINNVFYRYDDDEVRFWLVYGRANSPMPAWGLQGGGPMNEGQINDLIDYLHHIQVPQVDTLVSIESNINSALLRLETADIQIQNEIEKQYELREEIEAAPSKLPVAIDLFEQVSTLLDSTEGIDTDQDGLNDSVENKISDLAVISSEMLGTTLFNLDPNEEKTSPLKGDLSMAKSFLSQLESQVINLTVTTENKEKYLVNVEKSLDYLTKALEEKAWEVSFDEVGYSTFSGDYESAKRAVGLFNAYCARCHTAGYSAGVPYTQEIASGGLGPSIRAGRANIQFKEREDMIDFIINGSYIGKPYGVNGVGGGRMPGFGTALPESDIALIVDFLRGLSPDA